MFCVSLRLLPGRIIVSVCCLFCLVVISGAVYGQNGDGPLFSEFKGVRIGMPTEEARKKLGSPKEKGDEQDYYLFNETQQVMVYYDKKTKAVTAISIDFMNGANQIPTAREIIGSEPESKSDGSTYKMVRYPKAGYWVAYSRTAGKAPTVTITIQKID